MNTLVDWEANRHTPAVWFVPRIIAFLGYDPNPAPRTFGEQIVAARRRHGLSRNRVAKLLGIDEGTLKRWEENLSGPGSGRNSLLEAFLAGRGARALDDPNPGTEPQAHGSHP